MAPPPLVDRPAKRAAESASSAAAAARPTKPHGRSWKQNGIILIVAGDWIWMGVAVPAARWLGCSGVCMAGHNFKN